MVKLNKGLSYRFKYYNKHNIYIKNQSLLFNSIKSSYEPQSIFNKPKSNLSKKESPKSNLSKKESPKSNNSLILYPKNQFKSTFINDLFSPINNLFNNNLLKLENTNIDKSILKNDKIDLKKEKLEYEIIDEKIESIQDLINIGKNYDKIYKNKNKRFNLDIKILSNLVEPLEKLNNMIGMNDVKKQIFEQIIFYLQNLDDKNFDMLHTVIAGEPGIGKTELAKILSQIYNKMGILSKGTFKSVKRADLIGGYLGQTAIKTKKILDSCKGGVLFIDEAYSLGNKEGKDTYSKECIDTLTAFLSEEKEDCVVIIAGYKNDLKKCFFNYNSGLERRFNWFFELKSYSGDELRKIFFKKIYDYNWKVKNENKIPVSFFENNKENFKYNGGDMETLFHKTKMCHSLRVLKYNENEKKQISFGDIKKGFKLFMKTKSSSKKNDDNFFKQSMYI